MTDTLRILVVDDYDAAARTLGWMMEALGHDVRVAHDGPTACKIAREYLPHVILLDIGLPGMNGYDVCRALKPESGLANTLFVAQTGWGMPEHSEQIKKAGFDHHLVKPVTLETIEKLLQSLPTEEVA